MDYQVIKSMTEDERASVLALRDKMSALIETMVESFGFEDKDGTDYHSMVLDMVYEMEQAEAALRPELMADFNAVFNLITMVYFEPDKFFPFTAEYRDAEGVLQLDSGNISEFYGKTMAKLSIVKADFTGRFELL